MTRDCIHCALPRNRRGAVRPSPSTVTASLGRILAALLACAPLLAMWSAPARSATRDYYFTPIGSERGLAQNTVTAMVQDSRGFVWVGTQGGLHRYDGQRYTRYRHDPRDPATLPDSFITALALEGERTLWVGSYSQYVSKIDLAKGTIQRFATDPDSGRAGRQVMALLAHHGHLWIATPEGLERLDPATGEHRQVVKLEQERLRRSPSQQLLADRAGNVWWASAAGLFRVGRDGKARLVGAPVPTHSLLQDGAGVLWVGRRDGLFRLDGAGLLSRAWPLVPGPDTQRRAVRAIARAPDGALWLSVVDDGLRRFDPAGGGVRTIREIAQVEASLPEDTVNTLMVDRGGILDGRAGEGRGSGEEKGG